MAFPPNPSDGQLHTEAGRQFVFREDFFDHQDGWFLTGAAGGDLDMSGFRIVNMADGINPMDAVNLRQVDRLIGEAIGQSEFIRYEHVQPIPAVIWNVTHNLHSIWVLVQVIDPFGNTIIPNIEFVDLDRVRLEFAFPVGGRAIIRR